MQETSSYSINTDVKHKLHPRTVWDCDALPDARAVKDITRFRQTRHREQHVQE